MAKWSYFNAHLFEEKLGDGISDLQLDKSEKGTDIKV